MDLDRFDLLAEALATLGARRRVLHLLVSLPITAVLASSGEDAPAASGRRRIHRRRRDRLSTEKKRKKKKRKKCKAKPLAQICSGQCGMVTNNCRKSVDCGPCGCGGACPPCQVCDQTIAACVPDPAQAGNACGKVGQSCRADGICSCSSRSCSNPTPICASAQCVACTTHADCGPNALCLADGSCQACTVTCPGGTCAGTQLQAAIANGGTIYVCPGRYTGRYNTFANVTLVGAGDGTNEASNTILDAQNSGRTFTNGAPSASLSRLRITGGNNTSSFGGGIYHVGGAGSGLTMTDCTVAGNHCGLPGGGIYNQSTTLTMTRCVVTGNDSNGQGGGIFNISTLNMTNCQITDNDSGQSGGGIYASGGTVTLDGCTVTRNDASVNGGGVIRSSPATVTLLNGTSITLNEPDNCFASVPGCTD